MSSAVAVYRCHGCDFSARVRYQSIALHYVLPNGDSAVTYRAIGWCNECEDIRDVEPDFDVPTLMARINDLSQNRGRPSPKLGLFGWLRREKAEPSYEDPELPGLRTRLAIAKCRSVKSRCLTCGAPAVTYFETQDDGTVSGLNHSCGGRLYRVPEDPDAPRFSFRPKVLVMSNDGRVMGEG